MFKMINIFFLQLCLQMFSLNSFAFDIGQLMNKIQSTSVNTVDEAVALIPPNIRSHFTYLYQPHGLRMASFTEPEAILFDTDGTFFVNIGSPNKTMGNTIEILQYDKTSKTAELYALEFPLKRNKNGQFFKPKINSGSTGFESRRSNPSIHRSLPKRTNRQLG